MKTTYKSIMKYVFLGLLFTLLFVPIAMAQEEPLWEWLETVYDYGNKVQQTHDGGFIIAGGTYYYIAGKNDVYLIKTDAAGNKEWQKTFGGNESDYGHSVQQTTDGGFIIVGDTYSYGNGETDAYMIKTDIAGDTLSYVAGSPDVYLIKTDAYGNKRWEKTFGGNEPDYGHSVQQTTDGGYIIVGRTRSYGSGMSDIYLVKTDAYGNKEWQKTFGGNKSDYGEEVQQINDGGYIIAGTTYSYGGGNSDVCLIKTDVSGNKLWQKTFGGEGNDGGDSVQQTTDGGYIIAGSTDGDVYLIKTDAVGNIVWQKTFGVDDDHGYSVQQTTDGGYIIAGYNYSTDLNNDVYLIKTDAYGSLVWQKTFGGDWFDEGYSVQQTTDGGFIIAGVTYFYDIDIVDENSLLSLINKLIDKQIFIDADVYMIKTDAYGNKKWQKTFNGGDDK